MRRKKSFFFWAKLILTLFILIDCVDETLASKKFLSRDDQLFIEEDLLLFQNEQKPRKKRDVSLTTHITELGSGSPETTWTSIYMNLSSYLSTDLPTQTSETYTETLTSTTSNDMPESTISYQPNQTTNSTNEITTTIYLTSEELKTLFSDTTYSESTIKQNTDTSETTTTYEFTEQTKLSTSVNDQTTVFSSDQPTSSYQTEGFTSTLVSPTEQTSFQTSSSTQTEEITSTIVSQSEQTSISSKSETSISQQTEELTSTLVSSTEETSYQTSTSQKTEILTSTIVLPSQTTSISPISQTTISQQTEELSSSIVSSSQTTSISQTSIFTQTEQLTSSLASSSTFQTLSTLISSTQISSVSESSISQASTSTFSSNSETSQSLYSSSSVSSLLSESMTSILQSESSPATTIYLTQTSQPSISQTFSTLISPTEISSVSGSSSSQASTSQPETSQASYSSSSPLAFSSSVSSVQSESVTSIAQSSIFQSSVTTASTETSSVYYTSSTLQLDSTVTSIGLYTDTSINSVTIASSQISSLASSTLTNSQSSSSLSSAPTSTSSTATSTSTVVSPTSSSSSLTSEITATTTTTTQPTIISNVQAIVSGSFDKSITSYWNNSLSNVGYSVNLNNLQIPINLFDGSYSSLSIYPNGFITLGTGGSLLNFGFPSVSILSYKIAIIAPFWFKSAIGTNTDITYSRYDSSNMDIANVLNPVTYMLNTRLESRNILRKRRAVSRISYTPDIIYIFTWKNLLNLDNTNESATVQLILAASTTQQKTFAIFNYINNSITWPASSSPIFIGYTSGTGTKYLINSHSNIIDSRNEPSLVDSEVGNTNKVGLFVYDLGYAQIDSCTSWYDGLLATNYTIPNPSLKPYIQCPLSISNAQNDPLYIPYTGKIWQKNAACYYVSSKIFSNNHLLQFCCYDTSNKNSNGSLIIEGFNSGFIYNISVFSNLISIINAGFSCCRSNDPNYCQKFYKICPPSLSPKKKKISMAWFGGDPQLRTYDNLTYTFNGFGKFLLSKANDSSFEIQARTRILYNVNDASISGTMFNAFALRLNDSMVFEIRLNDSAPKYPFMELYVNRDPNVWANFSNNLDFYNDFTCLNSTDYCNSISQNENFAKIIFKNGLIVKFVISTASSISWLSASVSLLDEDGQYTNSVYGLLGNNNGIQTDDIVSRDGQYPDDLTKERSIYSKAITWKLLTSEVDLFIAGSSRDTTNNYQPTFLEDILNNNTLDAANLNCNNYMPCIVDSVISGVPAIGVATKQLDQSNKVAASTFVSSPPFIKFRSDSVRIDWSNLNNPINVIADVVNYNPDKSLILNYNITNALNYSVITVPGANSSISTVMITYYPKVGEYPIFNIIARDGYNLSASNTQANILICNCNSVDSTSTCLYSYTQTLPNLFNKVVTCLCSPNYYGSFCDQVVNYCSLGDWCNLYPGSNQNSTCVPLNITEQIATNMTFKCLGNCSPGFYKNSYGACIDIDECANQTLAAICNTGKCVNLIGNFTCQCDAGYVFKNNSCQFVDYCKTTLNNCDSICVSSIGSFACDCYPGYTLYNYTKCIKTANTPSCDTTGCSQLCIETNNTPVCKCSIGYYLGTDGKTCQDTNECLVNNGGCSNYCNNTIGSFFCSCPIGMKLDTDQQTCISCPPNMYGLNCQTKCSCANSISCDSVTGCICSYGYTGDYCDIPIDFCANVTILTSQHSVCRSYPGYYQTECLPGYEKRNSTDNTCYPINYCLNDVCPIDSNCTTVDGQVGYNCSCSAGFYYNSVYVRCQDINECTQNPNICGNNACYNNYGGYNCGCPDGYIDNLPYPSKNPNCTDINECQISSTICPNNQTCQNTIGSYLCVCQPGLYKSSSGDCVVSLTTTEPTKPASDSTGLVLAIVLPISVVIIMAVLSVLVCYCWFKLRAESLEKKKNENEKNLNHENEIEESLGYTSAGKSMFINQQETPTDYFSKINEDEDTGSILKSGGPSKTIYRTNYPFENKDHVSELDFFKKLEDKARLNQHKTIVRPQSIFTDSSFSLPTGYYEQTTPYLSKSQYPLEDSDNENIDDVVKNNNLDEEDINDDEYNDDLFGAVDNDDESNDFIEAFNPNVKIPRPKLQFNPLKIFKFGEKPYESTE